MSGTSSSTSSSTSGRGSFSSSRPDRGSISTESPDRTFSEASSSTMSQTRSSSARPTIERPAVLHDLLDGDDLAGQLGAAGEHDVERLVEHDLGATAQVLGDVGQHGHPHLAAARVHVDGVVVVDGGDGAVGRRRLRELLDLFAQRGDVVARLAEGVGQLLVLGDRLGQLALGLEQALLEGAHPLGGVLEPATQGVDLLLEVLGLGPQVRQLGPGRGQAFLVRLSHPTSTSDVGGLRGTLYRHPRHSAEGNNAFTIAGRCRGVTEFSRQFSVLPPMVGYAAQRHRTWVRSDESERRQAR